MYGHTSRENRESHGLPVEMMPRAAP
jgi:hypothetical protein